MAVLGKVTIVGRDERPWNINAKDFKPGVHVLWADKDKILRKPILEPKEGDDFTAQAGDDQNNTIHGLSVKELTAMVKELRLPIPRGATKDVLVGIIEEYQAQASPAEAGSEDRQPKGEAE